MSYKTVPKIGLEIGGLRAPGDGDFGFTGFPGHLATLGGRGYAFIGTLRVPLSGRGLSEVMQFTSSLVTRNSYLINGAADHP